MIRDLHPHTDDDDGAEVLDALVARLELRDPDASATMRVEVVALSVDRSIGSGEDQILIEERVERANVARESCTTQRRLGGRTPEEKGMWMS